MVFLSFKSNTYAYILHIVVYATSECVILCICAIIYTDLSTPLQHLDCGGSYAHLVQHVGTAGQSKATQQHHLRPAHFFP